MQHIVEKNRCSTWKYIQEFAITTIGLTHDLVSSFSANVTMVPRLLHMKFTSDLRDKLLSLWPKRILQLCSLQYCIKCQLCLFMINNFIITSVLWHYMLCKRKTFKNLSISQRDSIHFSKDLLHQKVRKQDYNYNYNHLMALWISSRTTWVSHNQKKHSPTHTYHGYQSSLICSLLWSMASSLFNLHACLTVFLHNLSPSFL